MNRPNDVTRKTVVPLKEAQGRVPRNSQGDPAFTHLQKRGHRTDVALEHQLLGVQDVFTDDQIVAIVNRWLYQAEYQQESHRKRAEEHQRLQKPVKEAAKRLFPSTSFINLTPEQLEEAIQEVVRGQKGETA